MPDGHAPLTNTKDLDTATINGFKALYAKDKAIELAILEHVQDLKDDRKEIWKKLSADLDVPLKDLGLFYKLYKRQEESRDFEEEDEGAKVRDAHRQLFDSLAKGETLNFVDVLKTAGKRESKPAADVFETEAEPPAEEDAEEQLAGADPAKSPLLTKQRGEGEAAFDAARGIGEDPYEYVGVESQAWRFGYFRRQGAKAFGIGAALKDCPYPKGSQDDKAWRAGFTAAAKASKAASE